MVCPVMDYGSAIWGFKTYDKLEQVHNRAMRFFAGVHRLCPKPGFTGDMGWLDCLSRWKIERTRFWNRLVKTDDNRLVKRVFLWDIDQYTSTNKGNFVSHVNQICSETDLKHCFSRNTEIDLKLVTEKLQEKFASKWQNSCNMAKLDLYREIKTTFGVAKYLTLNIDRYEKALLSQLRYGILPLRVETGRYVGENHDDRICTLCDSNIVEDQIHFVFHCKKYKNFREELNNKAKQRLDNWDDLQDIEKLIYMFDNMTRVFAKYIRNIFILRRDTLYKSTLLLCRL